MHSPRGVEKILPVAKSDLFLLFHSPLVSCSESLHRRWRNYVSFTFLKFPGSCSFFASPFCMFFFFFIDVFNNDLWHYLGELSDLSLRRLARRLESTVIASRAPGRNHRSLQESSSQVEGICQFHDGDLCISCKFRAYRISLLNTTNSHSAVDSAYVEESGHTIWRVYLPLQTSLLSTQLAERS